MGRVIVVQYITLDGVVEDPDGSDRTTGGGWAMRYGPEGVAGDKFRLGSIVQTGVLLLGFSPVPCGTRQPGVPHFGCRSSPIARTALASPQACCDG